jgi:3',5'-cyclic AMP phosphodiesterase CpdA
MRIVATSDTHWQPFHAGVLAQFVQTVAALRPDCFILAGDIGEGLTGVQNMLSILQKIECPRLILPGNHDLWSFGAWRSDLLFEQILPETVAEHDAIWLETQDWRRDGLAICGTIGWYDYSGRDPELGWTDEQYQAAKPRLNNDGNFIQWPYTDLEFANRVGDALEVRLTALQNDPTVHEILIVTHVPPFAEAITRLPGNVAWNAGNAYFYNLTLGRRIIKYPKVTRVVSGHTHIGKDATIISPHGTLDFHVIDSDYGSPVYLTFDYPNSEYN